VNPGRKAQPGPAAADQREVSDGRRWYLAVTGLLTLAHPFLGPDARAYTYFLAGAGVGAVISDGRLGADELISRADREMYRAKQEHRATVPAAGQ
jgi:GGDEF domain-containing protein